MFHSLESLSTLQKDKILEYILEIPLGLILQLILLLMILFSIQ